MGNKSGFAQFVEHFGLKPGQEQAERAEKVEDVPARTGGSSGWAQFKKAYGLSAPSSMAGTPPAGSITTPEEQEKMRQDAVAQVGAFAGELVSNASKVSAENKPMLDYQEYLKQTGQKVDTSKLVKGSAEYNAFMDGFYRWQGDKYLADASASTEKKQSLYGEHKNRLMDEIKIAQQSGDPAAIMDAVKRYKAQYDTDSAALDQNYTDNKMSYWANRMNFSDFESKGKYAPKVQSFYDEDSYYKNYLSMPEAERKPIWDTEISFADALYESVNGNYLMFIKLNNDERLFKDPMWKKLHKKYQDATTATLQMSQEERQVFNYVFETEGVEKAIEFLNDMAEDLDARFNTYWMQKVAQRAKEDPFWESLGTVAMAPMRAIVGGVGMAEDYLSDGELEKDAWYSQLNRETAVTRGTVGNQIRNSWAGDVGAFLYDAGMSVGDNVMNTVAMGGNQWLSALLTGSDAAVNATDDALNRGLSSDQAMTIGILSGIGETLMEKVSLGTILDKKALSGNALKNIIKSAGVEGLEEVSTELWNTVADVIIAQDKSKWQMAIDSYKEKGLSEGAAFWRAVGDKAVELGYNFLAGATAGGMMSGGNLVMNAGQVRQSAQTRKLLGKYLNEGVLDGTLTSEQIQGMVNEGLALGKGTGSYALAEKIQTDMSKGKMPKGETLAQLVAQSYTDADGKEGAKPVSIPQIATKQQTGNNPASGANAHPAAPEGAVGESAAADMVAPEAMDADGGLVPGAAWMKPSTEDTVRNDSNNGGNLYEGNTGILLGEQGRVPGSGAIGQTGSVANGSAGTGRSVDQRRTAVERQNLVNAQNTPAISTAELGVTKGTNEKTVRVMPEELWDDAQRTTAQRIQEKTGKQVTFVVGGLLINGPDGPAMANGVWTKNGIVIRADHLRYTIDQIADHEIFHDAAFRTPGLVMSIEAEIREKFGDEALDAVVEQYIKALRGIAGIPDGATQEQIDAIAFEILEEIWADAYAGVNRFGAGANQFQNEVSQLSERVAPMQSMKQDNSVEQPTGPPADKFSIEEIQGENGVYGQGVVLDTTLFDGLKPRQWGEVLSNYVYSNLAGSQITVYDEFNQPETIHFAKVNDRVKKDGAKNSHKVIDKLARYRGDNVSALGIVHIDELLQTSRYDKSTDEHNHQWMDENGWELRKTYIQESDGTIYEATLNIANGRDRRILYAISNVRQIDKGGVARGDVPSTVSGRGSLTKSNSSNETIADSEHDVKQRFSMDDAVGEEHLRPEDLKDVPMYRPKPKSLYRADSERAVDTRLVSDAEAHAAAVKGAIFRNMSKEDFDGTDALKKLGVKVDNSVGIYSMVKSMIANDRSAKAVIKALRKAQVRLGATPGERNYASGIADGIYSSSNIPGDMDADKVMELADYYWAVKAITSDQITKQRDSIHQTLQDKIERIMRRVDTTKIKPPRAFTLHHRTAGRNMVSIFGPEIGDQLNAFLFNPVAVNEAERYRFVNRMHDTVRKFTGKDGKSKKLNKIERALVQQVIEGRAVEETVAGMEMRHAIKNAAHNIRNGEDAGDAAREFSLNTEERRLAEQYSRWLQTQDALKNDKVDEVRVDNAVQKYSEMFGLFYDAINDFLVAHGYEPIGFIKGYVPHLQPEANQNALSKALENMGLSKDVSNLPTNIAGLTKNFKPNKRFNPYFLSRHGDVTQYDIVTAFESYVDYMSDVLYHTDDIMRVRQASQYFRKTFAPEENRNLIEQALELRYGTVESKLEFLRENGEISMFSYPSAEDVDITLDKYLDRLFGNLNDKTVYSDFVMWMDDYANKLAGKQLMTDRDLERTMGRTSLNWVSKLARAFSRAQIAGNLSSALNQTAQLPQVIGENGIKNTAVAVRDFAFCRLKRAGWRQESDFLTEKEGIHYIANTKMDMVVDAAFKPLQWYDGFISTIAVRSKYLKEIQNGASHSEAMKAADKFGRNVMGSRAKGTIPLAFQSKGIVSQFFHLFQVEAANSWEHIVVDLPQDFKDIQKSHGTKAAAGSLAGVIVKTLIAAFLLNRIDEELYGGTPAPYDLLGLTANFIASGQELSTNEFLKTLMDNCWESVTGDRIFDTDDDSLHDGKFNWGGAFEDTLFNVTNDIPYLRNAAALLGLGDETLPIPDLAGSAKDIVDAISDEGLISYDMGQAILGLAGDMLPGGRQIEKTVAGIETAIRGGKYKGTGDNSKLQYPVDVDPWTALRLALFGDAAAAERNQFYTSGDSALSEKQTSVYQSLVNQGADSKELYAAIQDYREVSNDDSLSSVQRGKQCRDIIRSLDMSDELKLEMYEGMTGAKSTVESFRILMDAGLSWNDVMDVYDRYSELKANKELRPQDQAGRFAKWVDQQKYSSNQRTSIKEQLLFWNMYPAQAAQYEEFVELGLSSDDAYELAEQLDDLEPETGTDKVTDVQRWRACVEFSYKPGTQLAALAGVMDDAQLLKARVAYEMDVNPDTYVTLKERLPEYDLNHDGSMTNAEVKAAVDSMRGLSYKQKAVLWQLNVNSKSAKNNPYSTVVGQQVLDAKNEG